MNNQRVDRARVVFKVLAQLFAVCIMIQVFLAGLALFWDSEQWASHTGFSRFLLLPPVLMLIASFIARLPVSLRWSSVGLIVMLILMGVTANVASNAGVVAALHPVIAFLMFGATMTVVRKTSALMQAEKQGTPG